MVRGPPTPGKGKAREATEEEQAAARKEVRFSVANLEWHMPKQKPETRVSIRASLANECVLEAPVDDGETGTVRIVDAAGNEAPATEINYAYFRRHISKRLDNLRYTTTLQEIQDDLKERLLSLAAQYASDRGPTMPFTVIGELEGWPEDGFRGVMNKDTWLDLVNKYPDEMWSEFKIRTMMMMASNAAIQDLHHHCTSLDRNLQIVHDWVPALYLTQQDPPQDPGSGQNIQEVLTTLANKENDIVALQEDLKERITAIAQMKDIVQNDTQTIDELRKEIDDTRVELQQTRENQTFLVRQNQKLTTELEALEKDGNVRPSIENHRVSILRDHGRENRDDRHTPGGVQDRQSIRSRSVIFSITGDEPSTDKTKKSTKLPDPEPFTNEKGKDSPTFDVWYRQMINKVEVNRDHFANDRALLAYIESRIRGKAAEDLAPYLRE
ncbi:hypothetical protein QBC35DRAFT_457742, partial [Podospora australis]